jgi:hypothetical protein
MQPETKLCPLCAETIQASAKVCPHCRRWQRRWSFHNPEVWGGCVLVFYIVIMTGLVMFIERILSPAHDFAQRKGEISVVRSERSHRITSGTNQYVTVVGVITNHGNLSWKDINLEARFYNSAGELIDVIQGRGDYGGIPILAHSEAAFKIETRAAQPTNAYASHQVIVSWGKDESAWP